MAYIQLRDVVKQYVTGDIVTVANNGVTFDIEKGEFVVIVGASGAGKSTTLNILGGMDYCTSGQVWIDGENIATYSEKQLTTFRRHNVGFVFQHYNLVPNLTAIENVELMTQIAKSSVNAEEILTQCGLYERRHNFPAQLSGGEQQRVSIARALSGNPKLLLCDEPTGALDYETGVQILSLLQNMCRTQQTTVVVITHNAAIADMANRVIRIHDGKVAQQWVNESPIDARNIQW